MDQPHTDAVEDLFQQGCLLLSGGDFKGAASWLRQCVALAPEAWQAHANLALALEQQGQAQAAETAYLNALDIEPYATEVLLNFGAMQIAQKRLGEAQIMLDAAVRLAPENAAAWSNLGVLHLGMNDQAQAETCLRQALQLDQRNTTAKFNLSYLLLRQGRFEEGWQAFEARDWYRAMAQQLTFPRWSGEPLHGKSLLMVYEAGHGDMIQFCRYIPLLKTLGVFRLSLLCHPALKRLLQQIDGLDEVMGYDEPLPPTGWDRWTPLMSLPLRFQTRLDNVPTGIPYLHAEPSLVQRWAEVIARGKLNVGLVWQGNPAFENDADRSLPSLGTLAPLWRVPGVSFFALQKGAAEFAAEATQAALPIANLGPELADFADAAAVVMNLDLVICVDTAIAHLTGALGKPCWLLLPDYMTDWRWGASGAQSYWYPGVMRLFRQPSSGERSSVVEELACALQTLAGQPDTLKPHFPDEK